MLHSQTILQREGRGSITCTSEGEIRKELWLLKALASQHSPLRNPPCSVSHFSPFPLLLWSRSAVSLSSWLPSPRFPSGESSFGYNVAFLGFSRRRKWLLAISLYVQMQPWVSCWDARLDSYLLSVHPMKTTPASLRHLRLGDTIRD